MHISSGGLEEVTAQEGHGLGKDVDGNIDVVLLDDE